MEIIKNQNQSKAKAGDQIVLMDPAITAETDELNPKFEEDNNANTQNQTNTKPPKP